jgi:hypothetical protein
MSAFSSLDSGASIYFAIKVAIWLIIPGSKNRASPKGTFLFAGMPEAIQLCITWWSLNDQGSWREGGGMLRKDLSPKPVYETLKKLIHEEWRTSLQGKTDNLGRFQFSGFYGLFSLTLQMENISKEAEFHLVKGKQNEFTYNLEYVRISPPTNLKFIR